jgi:hypothetical protein
VPSLQILTLKTKNKTPKTGGGALPPTRTEIHCASWPKGHRDERSAAPAAGGRLERNAAWGDAV